MTESAWSAFGQVSKADAPISRKILSFLSHCVLYSLTGDAKSTSYLIHSKQDSMQMSNVFSVVAVVRRPHLSYLRGCPFPPFDRHYEGIVSSIVTTISA